MNDLRDLYQEVLLDHYKKPRNFRKIDQPTAYAHGHNALCGDKVTVYITLGAGKVEDISFEGSGCAICTASASLMTESLKGRTEAEAETIFKGFHDMITDERTNPEDMPVAKLQAFAGVRDFPVRVKCATLPWHTFEAALHRHADEQVSTE